MSVGIYKITSPSNKIYIGQSTNIEERWEKGHKYNCGSGKKLKNSINKYGWEKHQKEIIEVCLVEELSLKETYWINYYNSYKNGLNSTSKGGVQGYKNEKLRQKQSSSLKGREGAWTGKKRPEHSEWMKNNNMGKYLRTDEHRIILKEKMVGKIFSKETCNLISQNKTGKGLKPIICDTLYGVVFNSIKEASNALDITPGNVCDVLKGRIKHIKGFTFRYYQKDFM
jgi:group I intron endonuclease